MPNDNHLLAKIGQYALIKNDDRVLVLERARSKTWSLPGGRLEKDEAWDKAFLRELKEETNLDCTNPLPVAVNIIEDAYQVKYCVYFSVEILNIDDLKISPEHSNYKWVDLTEAKTLNFEDEKIRDVTVNYSLK